MTKIRLLANVRLFAPEGGYTGYAREEVEVDAEQAQALIAAGNAEAIASKAEPDTVVDSKSAKPSKAKS